jgi:hypothetical protein
LSRSPIPRVLSTFQDRGVEALLMGGQACILYGGAEFSRDADFAVVASPANLERLRRALDDLDAEVIAVPPFESRYLERGHAVHFRAHHPEAAGFRIDIMAKLRGVEPFSRLWERRTSFELDDIGVVEVLSLPDLVASKKTQRDKDWVMIRGLLEASYARGVPAITAEQLSFWLTELRTAELLIECAADHPDEATRVGAARPATAAAAAADLGAVTDALHQEEERERARDREYWAPLRRELEALRRRRDQRNN